MSITNFITARRAINITSSAAAVIYDIQPGAMIRLIPTGSGSATLYSTGSPFAQAALDVASGSSYISGSINANWIAWDAGTVSADTIQTALLPQTAVAVIVTSGTWTLEVCQ